MVLRGGEMGNSVLGFSKGLFDVRIGLRLDAAMAAGICRERERGG